MKMAGDDEVALPRDDHHDLLDVRDRACDRHRLLTLQDVVAQVGLEPSRASSVISASDSFVPTRGGAASRSRICGTIDAWRMALSRRSRSRYRFVIVAKSSGASLRPVRRVDASTGQRALATSLRPIRAASTKTVRVPDRPLSRPLFLAYGE
jgi:hypothetical protein